MTTSPKPPAKTPTRTLRVSHVIVQPVLVWDDGEELEPGPGVEPQQVPLKVLADLPALYARQCAEMTEQANQ